MNDEGLVGLSMQNFGGFAIFDLRSGNKTLSLHDMNASKSELFGRHVMILTNTGSLELYDHRKMLSGPVMVYNSEFKPLRE